MCRGWKRPRPDEAEVLRDGLSARVTTPKIQLEWTSIAKITGKEESQNILGESCCHRIKCTAINSLATLIWRWCLNSEFQPYSYYIRTYGECWWDKYPNRPSSMHVEDGDEKERQYKRRRSEWEKGGIGKKHCSNIKSDL